MHTHAIRSLPLDRLSRPTAVILRQQNIPADPPSRDDVTALMRNMDTDRDGQLNLKEFHAAMQTA